MATLEILVVCAPASPAISEECLLPQNKPHYHPLTYYSLLGADVNSWGPQQEAYPAKLMQCFSEASAEHILLCATWPKLGTAHDSFGPWFTGHSSASHLTGPGLISDKTDALSVTTSSPKFPTLITLSFTFDLFPLYLWLPAVTPSYLQLHVVTRALIIPSCLQLSLVTCGYL